MKMFIQIIHQHEAIACGQFHKLPYTAHLECVRSLEKQENFIDNYILTNTNISKLKFYLYNFECMYPFFIKMQQEKVCMHTDSISSSTVCI